MEVHAPMEKQKKALITGINGFVGKWLTEQLQRNGYQVYGFDRLEQCLLREVIYHPLDILDTTTTTKLLTTLQPDLIFHLAAISFLPDADMSPKYSLDINITGTISLLDAVKDGAPQARTLLVGSSKEYNDTINAIAVTEETPPVPTNFYGISKYAGELIGLQYARQFGLFVVCTRSFNHTGPGQSPRFVCSEWAKQIAAIELGQAEPVLSVGDTSATIDFSDVRDVVVAYRLILEQGKLGEVYNVASGKGYALSWILSYLTAKSTKKITIQQASTKNRAHQTNRQMIGSNNKLRQDTSWKPTLSLETSLDDLYHEWITTLQVAPR